MPDYPEYEGVYGGENDEDYREHCRIAQQCHDEASDAWGAHIDFIYKEYDILADRATLKPSDKEDGSEEAEGSEEGEEEEEEESFQERQESLQEQEESLQEREESLQDSFSE